MENTNPPALCKKAELDPDYKENRLRLRVELTMYHKGGCLCMKM